MHNIQLFFIMLLSCLCISLHGQTACTPYDFNPYHLDDLPTLWLDASDGNSLTIVGNQVTAWNDISGNNFQATQTDPTRQAIHIDDNGFPMVEFNGMKFMSIPITD